MTKPEPSEVALARLGSARARWRSKNSLEELRRAPRCRSGLLGLRPFWVVEMLTTAGSSFSARSAKLSGRRRAAAGAAPTARPQEASTTRRPATAATPHGDAPTPRSARERHIDRLMIRPPDVSIAPDRAPARQPATVRRFRPRRGRFRSRDHAALTPTVPDHRSDHQRAPARRRRRPRPARRGRAARSARLGHASASAAARRFGMPGRSGEQQSLDHQDEAERGDEVAVASRFAAMPAIPGRATGWPAPAVAALRSLPK